MNGDDSATLVIRDSDTCEDRYAEVVAWYVPESDRYPDGVKYSFQYGERDGDTIFRYDNFPDHPDTPHHHKHTRDGGVEGVEFDGVFPLFQRFKNEVNQYGHDWH